MVEGEVTPFQQNHAQQLSKSTPVSELIVRFSDVASRSHPANSTGQLTV